ncbi:hypothetical protein BH23BAC4_BH23BAC4_08390 [soil metagenome]
MRFFAFLAASLLGLSGCAGGLTGTPFTSTLELRSASLEREDLYGTAMAGRVTVVSFFTPDCPDCHHFLRDMDELRAIHGNRPDLIAIAVTSPQGFGSAEDPRPEMRAYLSARSVSTPAYWDAQGRLTTALNAETGQTVVVDRDGRIVFRQRSQIRSPRQTDRLIEAVDRALERD